MKSKKYTLTRTDIEKIGMGALIALAGALLTYASQILVQTDFGDWTPVVVAMAGIAINAARKWLDGRDR